MRAYHLFGLVAVALLVVPVGTATAAMLYGSQGSFVYAIDPATAAISTAMTNNDTSAGFGLGYVSPAGLEGGPTVNAAGSSFWGVVVTGGTTYLLEYDSTKTGAAMAAGSHVVSNVPTGLPGWGAAQGLAYSAVDNAFYVSFVKDDVNGARYYLKIDATSYAATAVAIGTSLGGAWNDTDGLGVDPLTNKLYGSCSDKSYLALIPQGLIAGPVPGGPANDITAGISVYDFSAFGAVATSTSFGDMAASAGTLWSVANKTEAPTTKGDLYKYDIATKTDVLIGNIGANYQIYGLAYVPEPSVLGLLGLALLVLRRK